MNKTLNILIAAALLTLVVGGARAGHHEGAMKKSVSNEVIEIKVKDDESGEPVKIRLDSEQTGLKLSDLAPGETRSVTDSYGQAVVVTRVDDGYQLMLDGRTFDVPLTEHAAVTAAYDKEVEMVHGGEGHDGEVRKEIRIVSGGDDGFVLISPRPLDEATKQQLRDAFAAAGLDGELQILDQASGPEMTTMRKHKKVHVIREKVDAD